MTQPAKGSAPDIRFTRILLAYSGSLESSAAIPWLMRTYDAEVVTLTLDVGQVQRLEELQAYAVACGATRAHVIDVRDEFARDCVLPSLHAGAGDAYPVIAARLRPLVAGRLVEMAAIEGSSAVAHVSRDEAFDLAVAAINPTLRVIAPAREWNMDAGELADYARGRGLRIDAADSAGHPEQHLLVRPAGDPAEAPDGEAQVELTFKDHVPVAINGVPMSAAELIESLSLIAGYHGVGWRDAMQAPAALVLYAAYEALRAPAGIVRLRLSKGRHIVLDSHPQLVTSA